MTIVSLRRDGEIEAGPLPAEILAWFRNKKLKPTFDYRETWLAEHDLAFSAAKIMRTDVLAAMHEELARAIEQGVPFNKWAKQVEPRFREMGWWDEHEVIDPKTGKVAKVNPPSRLKTIFSTNMRMARAAGQWDRIQKNKRWKPYLLYVIGPSERHRPLHVSWNGVLLPCDDPWWLTHFCPNGWGCKCGQRAVSEREARRLEEEGVPTQEQEIDDDGLPTGHLIDKTIPVQRTAPKVVLKPWKNDRTGKVELVPEGVDPGFHYRPDLARQRVLSDAAE